MNTYETVTYKKSVSDIIRSWVGDAAGVSEFVNGIRSGIRATRLSHGLDLYHQYHIFAEIKYDDLYAFCTEVLGLNATFTSQEYMFYSDPLPEALGSEDPLFTELFVFVDNTMRGKTAIKFEGDKLEVDKAVEQAKEKFPFSTSELISVHMSGGRLEQRDYQLDSTDERMPHSSFYPFLGEESLESYYDRFMKSKSKVLILLGEKGMGKTTFVRGLTKHHRLKVGVCADAAAMNNAPADVFDRLNDSNTDLNVFEDSDILLGKRKDGNFSMSQILNVADGLVPAADVSKMIFTSNLSNIEEIDDALTRHGRSFDIVTFRTYTDEEALAVAKDLCFEFDPDEARERGFGKEGFRLSDLVAMRDEGENYKERRSSEGKKIKAGFF